MTVDIENSTKLKKKNHAQEMQSGFTNKSIVFLYTSNKQLESDIKNNPINTIKRHPIFRNEFNQKII